MRQVTILHLNIHCAAQPTNEEIENLRRVLKKTFQEQLTEKERQIDDEHAQEWETKDDTLQVISCDVMPETHDTYCPWTQHDKMYCHVSMYSDFALRLNDMYVQGLVKAEIAAMAEEVKVYHRHGSLLSASCAHAILQLIC